MPDDTPDRPPGETGITLEQYVLDRQEELPQATGAFSRLLRDLSVAAKVVNRDLRSAGLLDIFGATGHENVHGEAQKEMDARADREFERALRRGGACEFLVSEEREDPVRFEAGSQGAGPYAVLLDPLDGSSNIDVNVSVGTIFSVYRVPPAEEVDREGGASRSEAGSDAEEAARAVLQSGTEQVAAGYLIYGSSTMLVYTAGRGVNGFTLDPSIGEFFLSHPNIEIPRWGRTYSINEGMRETWDRGLRRYVRYLQRMDEETRRPYTLRYIGSFVSDVHRNLLTGGIYMYPATPERPKGKLRLMYEANPMAFLIEEAGGRASDGRRRILGKDPESLHERTPIFAGSSEMVQTAEAFLAAER